MCKLCLNKKIQHLDDCELNSIEVDCSTAKRTNKTMRKWWVKALREKRIKVKWTISSD